MTRRQGSNDSAGGDLKKHYLQGVIVKEMQ